MAASLLFLSPSVASPKILVSSRIGILPTTSCIVASSKHPARFPLTLTRLPSNRTPSYRPRSLSPKTWRVLPPLLARPLLLSLSAATPLLLACGSALAADSIRASAVGLRIAQVLRGSGWPDGAIVFALATLPVLELRGAIPVGYWMQLHPLLLTALSVIGNMVPVPFILLYLKRLAVFLSERENSSSSAAYFLEVLLQRARDKAGPVKEFQWLGLMLFVAVPFPGTGAWTGAIVASVLDMPFWTALSANFVGVIFAGLLVNLLVNLGLKYAIATGVMLFFVSTFMWNVLRHLKTRSTAS